MSDGTPSTLHVFCSTLKTSSRLQRGSSYDHPVRWHYHYHHPHLGSRRSSSCEESVENMTKNYGPQNVANFTFRIGGPRNLNVTSPPWVHMWAPPIDSRDPHCPLHSHFSECVVQQAKLENSKNGG